MKKIIIALAAVAAAFCLASCSKEPLAEQPAADIKLDIRVAGFDESPATRAVKTSWVNGDKIIMWFMPMSPTTTCPNILNPVQTATMASCLSYL